MSGGFFRGTSADQDTRFSNKTAKLLKTQKFAPELDQLIDMSKIKMDTLRPWIATRVTQFLGFEDEVLINFIYELLEGKNVDGKQIQIQLTGFMEKNTGKFMKELWGLLTSAQNTASGIPQQLLDEKAEEARQKKAEEHRIISEVRRKEDEKRAFEQEVVKDEDTPVEVEKVASSTAPKRRSNSLSKGVKLPDGDQRNGTMDSRRRPSRSRSGSHLSSKSVSRSPRKRRVSHSVSRSPPRRPRRSRSPLRRGRSPNHARRSRTPPRRAWSPINTRSPRRRRPYSRSPRGRSPVAGAHSPRRRRSPQLSYSPRGRSPNVRSPRRRRSPVFTRSSPRRRKSPPRSPTRYRRRSPRYAHSPVRRNISPPVRRRHTAVSPQRHIDSSPRRRPRISSPRGGSLSPRVTWSSSPEAFSKSPRRRPSSRSPQRNSSASPARLPMKNSSTRCGNTSFVASPQHSIPPPSKGMLSKGSMSPVVDRKPHQHTSESSPVNRTVEPVSKAAESPPYGANPAAPMQHGRSSPSLSPRVQQGSPSLSEASPTKERCCSKSPLGNSRGFTREIPVRTGQMTQKTLDRMPMTAVLKKRASPSSREISLPDEEREGLPLKKSSVSDANADVSSVINRQSATVDKASGFMSKSSSEDQPPSPGGKWRMKDMEIGLNKNLRTASPVGLDDRKTAKRRRKEERRLRKEEKRRKREERHKRKEEKRANKFPSKGITSVTPPPDFDRRMVRSDGFDSPHDQKGEEEEMEIEQIKLENELRRKALDSIRARKVISS